MLLICKRFSRIRAMASARFLSFPQKNLIPGSPADEGVIGGGMQVVTEGNPYRLVEVSHLGADFVIL